ncbi:MAG: Xaa-Pro peptidase family protein [Alphaproteobacteria bacterium]|nr:Xaa-Pro peptidase family protein [Alphaproteobacteria bacterium]
MTRPEPQRGFPDEEFAARTAAAQRAMAAAGLDALLLTTEVEIRYLTGFLTRFWESPTRPWFVVLPASGKPIAVIPTIGAAAMARTWVEDIRTWSAPDPEDDGVSLLADALREALGAGGRLGLAEGRETHLRMPLGDFRRLQALLPGVAVADATALLHRLRFIKSSREIEKIAHVCDRVSGVFEEAPGWLRAGLSETTVFRRFKIACLAAGVDDVAYLVGGAGEGGYGDIISPPGERALAAGDVLMLDVGAVFDGYFCDFDRNFAVGPASQVVADAHRVLWEATEAGFEAARPGATCADLFRAMQAVIADTGFGAEGGEVGRFGHGLGMQLTELVSHSPWDETELAPGAVLTLEPSLTLGPGKVMVHEENIVVDEGGARWLTRRAPREIPVLPA